MSARQPFRSRGFALRASVAALAVAAVAAAPAAHASPTMPACDHDLSTRLFTGEVDGTPTQVWAQAVSTTEMRVCVSTVVGPVTLVVHTGGISYTLPTVTRTDYTRPDGCANGGVLLHAEDPVAFSISYGVTTTPSVCFGIGGDPLLVSVTNVSEVPRVEVWRDAAGTLATADCLDEYSLWQQSGGGTGSSEYDAYRDCYDYPRPIVS